MLSAILSKLFSEPAHVGRSVVLVTTEPWGYEIVKLISAICISLLLGDIADPPSLMVYLC